MADDFKRQGLRSREWGRKVRKAMKRSARTALKNTTAKESKRMEPISICDGISCDSCLCATMVVVDENERP